MEEKYRILDYFEDRKVSISRSAKSARTRLFHGPIPPSVLLPFARHGATPLMTDFPRDSFCPEEIEFQIWEQNCYE